MATKTTLAALVWLASAAHAAADPTLPDLMRAASACTDDRVQAFAANSCDPPTQVAALAVRACEDKWQALALVAVKPPATDAGKPPSLAYKRALQTYADGMKYEYSKIAELKAIDVRTGSDRCAPE